ncbi:hypothetical protein O9H85_17625 [Paenibacillus filicis]|uniref:Secreted protein n=1 Tax=Paenibacillus gyeongsangnamensis TaxID=3388067 RepID=A0ABT4QBF4_9BACL|nr:hypothetical protein [Paenibacillus filicis]MCZ8514215.1 hypothetical protein [Paenibacillus filicis]
MLVTAVFIRSSAQRLSTATAAGGAMLSSASLTPAAILFKKSIPIMEIPTFAMASDPYKHLTVQV